MADSTRRSLAFGGRAESWNGVERAKRFMGKYIPGSVAAVLSPSLFFLKPKCFARLYANPFAPVFHRSIK